MVGGGAGPELRKGIEDNLRSLAVDHLTVVVSIALPTIGRDFGTGVAARQWVMNGYTLTLAAFLLTGGSLGDRFGRQEVYLIGIVWFALASAACELAPDVMYLIITRVRRKRVYGGLVWPWFSSPGARWC